MRCSRMGTVPRDRTAPPFWIRVSCVFLLALVWACDRAPARDVTLMGASEPSGRGPRGSGVERPDQLPPASHTLDSEGFVDNGGRTSSERNRTEASGMRATETGSQVPAGTPGSGFPLPFGPAVRERTREVPANRWALGTPQPSGANARVVARKMARAYCDREWSCGRISVAEAWGSKARCIGRVDTRFYESLGAANCPDAFDPNLVPACLSSIRRTSCDVKIEDMASVGDCTPNTLCLPR